MNEDQFNMSLRKFLKKVGVTSQREIETAVRKAVENGSVANTAKLPVSVTLRIDAVDLSVEIDGEIDIS